MTFMAIGLLVVGIPLLVLGGTKTTLYKWSPWDLIFVIGMVVFLFGLFFGLLIIFGVKLSSG